MKILIRQCLRHLRRGALMTAFVLGATGAYGAVTVTDENGIVYDIIKQGERNVKVSSTNATIYQTKVFDLVIPPAVIDHSNTATDDDPWTVTEITANAFKDCKGIRSVTITAPFTKLPQSTFQGCSGIVSVSLPESLTSIEIYCFEGCTSLQSVEWHDGINSFGSYIFQNCTSLGQIRIPGGIKNLNGAAFMGCSSLHTVTLNEGLETTGGEVFRDCVALQFPALPTTLKTLGNNTFMNCQALGDITLTPGLKLEKYAFNDVTATSLTFPDEPLDVPSTETPFNNFKGVQRVEIPGWLETVPTYFCYGMSDLEEAVINEGVKTLGNNSFKGLAKLRRVTFPTTLATITDGGTNSGCFLNCTSLEDFVLPENVYVGKNAFYGCNGVRNLVLPAGITACDGAFSMSGLETVTFPAAPLGDTSKKPFGGCSKVKKLHFPGGMKSVPSWFISFSGVEEITFGEGIESISEKAFADQSTIPHPPVTSLTFPSTLKSIGQYAFRGFYSLAEVNFNDGLESIADYAFDYPKSLKAVRFPASLTYLGNHAFGGSTTNSGDCGLESIEFAPGSQLKAIGDNAFAGASNLQHIVYPEHLESIGSQAFCNCYNLPAWVPLPASIREVGAHAFSKIKNLGSVTLPGNCTYGERVFQSSGIEDITFEGENAVYGTYMFNQAYLLKEMTLPSWLTEIPEGFCRSISTLESVTMPEALERVGKEAFYNCVMLQNLELPPNVRLIEERGFAYCGTSAGAKDKLGHITLYEGVEIADNAFEKSTLLGITFEGCATFGNNVFKDVTTIESFAFPSCMEVIPDGFCNGWKQLKQVTLPEGVRVIGANAFTGTSFLREIKWPSTLDSIGTKAFERSGLTSFEWPGENVKMGTDIFYDVTGLKEVTVPGYVNEIPEGMFNRCSGLENITFAERTNPNDTLVIGKNAFYMYYTSKEKELIFPDVPIVYGDYCFNKHAYLGTLHLSERTVSLGNYAFADCGADTNGALTELDIPGSCEVIGDYCFLRCNKIRTVNIGEGVKEIGKQAFYMTGNNAFEQVSFPSTLQKIGDQAFRGTGIKSVGQTGVEPTVSWPESRIELGSHIFLECNRLEAVSIPAWMDRIPYGTFAKATNMKTLLFDERRDTPYANDTLTVATAAFAKSGVERVIFPDVPLIIENGVSYGNPENNAAFYSCDKLKELHLSDKTISLGSYNFIYCKALPEVTFPNSLTKIPNNCFSYCDALATVNIGDGVTDIDYYAFYKSGVVDINWGTNIKTVGISAFYDTKVVNLVLAPSITKLNSSAFSSCKLLETIDFADTPVTFEDSAFANCYSLRRLDFPATQMVFNGTRGVFENCTGLEEINFGQSMINFSGNGAFSGCTSLKRVDFPEQYTRCGGNNCFNGCTALEEVITRGKDVLLLGSEFSGCTALRRVVCEGGVKEIYNEAFRNCSALEEIVIKGDNPIYGIYQSAFLNCSSLREFPYLESPTILQDYVFQGCTSLTQMTLPSRGSYTKSTGGQTGMFRYDTALQSLVFPSTAPYFHLQAIDIEGAPLEAISYSYARDIKVPTTFNKVNATIARYSGAGNYSVTNPSKSILMVERGQKYKYEEYGYGQLFDIREMANPTINIEGDIWSRYDAEANVNHYTANLRWNVPLSDLNPEGPTKVRVYRDAVHVADVEFSQPSAPKTVAGFADPVIEVDVKVNGQPNRYSGDFDFGQITSSGDTIYVMEYSREEPQMYFDAKTHKRLVSVEKYGYTSWFVLVDKFDSPNLASGDAPTHYRYSAVMEGFCIDDVENNDHLAVGDDGLRYHAIRRTFDTMYSDTTVMSVPVVVPAIDFDGLYTFDQIAADTDATLAATKSYADGVTYKLSYATDPSVAKQRGQADNLSARYVIDNFSMRRVLEDGSLEQIGQPVNNNGSGKGSFSLPRGTTIAPGDKLQTVTTSLFRGTFGSPTLTVPDAPVLTGTLVTRMSPHFLEDPKGHTDIPFHSEIRLNTDATAVGYEEGHLLEDGEWHLGLWRTVSWEDAARQPSARSRRPLSNPVWDDPTTANGETELVHHVDGRNDECSTTVCDDCNISTGVTAGEDGHLINDTFLTKNASVNNVDYTVRAYVKVPDAMLPGQQKYMLAEVPLTASGDHMVTEIEEIGIDDIDPADTDVRWYDLRGVRLAAPPVGQPCIRLTPQGATKVIIR